MSDTIFDKIVDGRIDSFKIWEDDNYLAFLTPFPSTPGMSVVIPKINQGDYIFELSSQQIAGLAIACQSVAKLLERALEVERVAMVFEGTGVAHVHAKLYPLHGYLANQTDVWIQHQEFYPQYDGHISTAEGPRMGDEELLATQQKILAIGATL